MTCSAFVVKLFRGSVFISTTTTVIRSCVTDRTHIQQIVTWTIDITVTKMVICDGLKVISTTVIRYFITCLVT